MDDSMLATATLCNRMRRIALIAVALALPLDRLRVDAADRFRERVQGRAGRRSRSSSTSSRRPASAGDAEKICTEILSKQLVTELKTAGGDCVTEMDRAIDDASDFNLTVRSVKVNGNTATAQVRQGDSRHHRHVHVREGEGGAWRARRSAAAPGPEARSARAIWPYWRS